MYGYEIFHEEILKELLNSVNENKTRQAYLFVGPQGVGRKNAACLFANALVCESDKNAPCTNCQACIGAKNNTNPDILYLKPEDKKTITIEQIRKVVQEAYVKPFESKKKVFIIEDGALLNEHAQNCLLKVLEEPPEYVVFIIIATSESVLLQTVLSRCTLVRFPALSEEKIKEYIKNKFPDEISNYKLLYRLCGGIPNIIDSILDDVDYNDLRWKSFKMLPALFSNQKLSAFSVAEFFTNNKDRLELVLDFWQGFLRDALMIKNGSENTIINIDMQDEIRKIAIKLTDEMLVIASEQVILAKTMNKKYVNLHSLALNLSFSIKKKIYNQ